MAKFPVSYVEVYRKTYIVEAESYEEAEEKVEQKAEDCGIRVDYVDDFDHWEVEPSETFGCKPIPENYDVSIFEALED